MIVIYGIGVRTSTSSTDTSLISYVSTISSGFYFLLAYTLISLKHKMFDWSMITNLLYILVITFQMNTLWYMFWASTFDGFNSTSSFNTIHIIADIQATLSVIIVSFQFIAQINRTQIFILSIIQVFAFAMNWAI